MAVYLKRIYWPITVSLIIFWCVTLELFSFRFVPLLARNPGNATVWIPLFMWAPVPLNILNTPIIRSYIILVFLFIVIFIAIRAVLFLCAYILFPCCFLRNERWYRSDIRHILVFIKKSQIADANLKEGSTVWNRTWNKKHNYSKSFWEDE